MAPTPNLPDRMTLSDETLELTLDTKENRFAVLDKRSRRVWQAHLAPEGPALKSARQEGNKSLTLELHDRALTTPFHVTISLKPGGIVSFLIEAAQYDATQTGTASPSEDVANVGAGSDLAGAFNGLSFPPPLTADLDHGKIVFCDRSCGVYLPLDDKTYGGRTLMVYGNTQCMDMPWIGVIDEDRGDGMMVYVETPFDAAVTLKPAGGGRHWPEVNWLPSMQTFRYPRQVSWRFSPEGGYVALAAMYREIARGEGRFVTLAEKIRRKPDVAHLRGSAIIWMSGPNPYDFVRQARPMGVTHAVIANAHIGLEPGQDLAELNDMGYVTTEYDSIGDILPGETGFQKDDVEEASYRTSPGADPQKGWSTETLQYYFRSSALAMRALRSYVPQRFETLKFNGRFMDVAVAMTLFEDYHPDHTFDRRQDMRYKRETLEYFNSFRAVMGTEHGNDWAIDLVDYLEGATSGPFWWISTPDGWNAGMLRKPTDRSQLTPEYLKYGMGVDTRIPLWELVYHDCAVTTWYWGDAAGFMYDVAPDISARKDLFNLLYGTVPLLWASNKESQIQGYGWWKPEGQRRFLETYHTTCHFHEKVFGEQLVAHAFLTDDAMVQRTAFSNGAEVVINFGDTPYVYEQSSVKAALAPLGYYASAPGFLETRLMVDGEPVAHIQTDGFQRASTCSMRSVGAFTLDGAAAATRFDGGHWTVVLDPETQCEVDWRNLAGQPAQQLEIDQLGPDGAILETRTIAPENGIIPLNNASQSCIVYVLRPVTG